MTPFLIFLEPQATCPALPSRAVLEDSFLPVVSAHGGSCSGARTFCQLSSCEAGWVHCGAVETTATDLASPLLFLPRIGSLTTRSER